MGVASETHTQRFGISQGCPLSPFLFVMLMTIVMQDAVAMLPAEDRAKIEKHDLAAVLYADDTLLLGRDAPSVQRLLSAIQETGAMFGLELHADKFQILRNGCESELYSTNGAFIEPKKDMVYMSRRCADN